MTAREVSALPKGEDWIYEFFWGGERVRAIKRDGGARLLSREGRDLTNRFPRIGATLSRLRASHTILDGEILYLGTYSEPAIRFLAEGTDEFSSSSIALLVYDVLCDEGKDVRPFSLLCRRLLLASIVQDSSIILSPLLDGYSETAFDSAARLGFRGIVAKRAGSPYRPSAHTDDWVRRMFPRELVPPGVRVGHVVRAT